MRRFSLLLGLLPAACGIHHVAERSAVPPPAADATAAAGNCFEAETALDRAICATPALEAANAAMLRAYHAALRKGGIFDRDAVLASQTTWKLDLAGRCSLAAPQPGSATACLAGALADRTRVLAAWHPGAGAPAAISNYVAFRLLGGTQPRDPALCAAVAAGANAALTHRGTADPAVWGAEEVAGTHGPPSVSTRLGETAVSLYDGNVYALYQRRARALMLRGNEVLGSQSLTEQVQSQSQANAGGRFTAFASQTGDYGALDVFKMHDRVLVLAEDAWGSTSPAAPGEFAHAGLWEVADQTEKTATPLCLYDTYEMPGTARFDGLQAFATWRETLALLSASASLPLGPGDLRDRSILGADSAFVVTDMPLVAVAEAHAGGWTNWLRVRHDAVLDALFAWSETSPEAKSLFRRVFAQMRPAAADLVRGYQRIEALNADEAREAAAITIMELLYHAASGIAPRAGADLAAPASAAGTHPRYPILAEPQ